MDKFLDAVRNRGRRAMFVVAGGLNRLTAGKVHPNAVTFIGLLAHLPIAYLIATDQLVWAAVLLVFFGLFDALDGALARLQGRAGATGMFLDSVTDRVKEVILYIGAGYLFVSLDQPYFAVWAVAACGLAVVVSYVNAWGEVVLAKTGADRAKHQSNKTFRAGLLTYDVRIFLFIIGLLFGVLEYIMVTIAVLSLITIIQRMSLVLKKLA